MLLAVLLVSIDLREGSLENCARAPPESDAPDGWSSSRNTSIVRSLVPFEAVDANLFLALEIVDWLFVFPELRWRGRRMETGISGCLIVMVMMDALS